MAANGIKLNHNGVVQPLLTDLYQITMAYAYWKSGKTNDIAVFDLYFRKNPFDGEFTIFAGLDECLKFLNNFRYSDTDIAYLKATLPESVENEFFDYLKDLTAKDITLQAIPEGSVVFPRVPIIKIQGPLIIAQLLETTLLTLVNYASLMATNAARYRMVAGRTVKLLEFGLRRAQGPDGGLSASKYSYIGGFDGTSNVLAGKLFNIPVKGTHAHAYITSFSGVDELKNVNLRHKTTGINKNILESAIAHRQQLSGLLEVSPDEANDGELAAMVSFAIAFPDGFMALVDTYDVKSNLTDDTIDRNQIDHTKAIEFDHIVHDTIKQLNSMHSNATTHTTSNNSSRCFSCNGSTHDNQTKDDVRHGSEVNNNNVSSSKSRSIETNAKDCSANQNGVAQNGCAKTNGYVNGHSNRNRCTIVQNFQNYHKSNRSGLLNFSAVAMALHDQGYSAVGIRIDSGDLAYLSCLARDTFNLVAERFNIPWFKTLTIVASNDINEETILSLNEQGHKIDCFGIGTHLVTCQRQPALGCVYKLVEINSNPRTKLSEDMEKATMPGNKNVYRLYSMDGHALIDLLQKNDEPAPVVGQRVLCRHPLQESKRAYVTPSRVEPLYKVYWQNGEILQSLPTLEEIREKVSSSLRSLRNDHKRTLNPTPYKVSVSDELYSFIHNLWLDNQPILELS